MGWRDIKRVYFYIILGLGVLAIILQVVQYIPVVIRRIVSPETAREKFEHGRYSSWAWTPDGRIIYVQSIQQMEHTRGMGSMGYSNMGTVTQIRIMDADGNNDKLIKETYYQSARQKIMRRYREYQKKHFGFLPLEESDKINRESAEGILDKIYLDPPLSYVGWIDWNGKNNNLIFEANDGRGKDGIAVSDPEFREVKWIAENGTHPMWSPDGTMIAYAQFDPQDIENGIWICDSNGNNKKFVKKVENRLTPEISWFPDNKRIMITAGDMSIAKTKEMNFIIDLEGQTIKELPRMSSPSISPDGKWVAYFNVNIWKMDINGKNIIKIYPKGGSFFPKWSPDGKIILFGWEGGIEVINPDGTGYNPITFKE